MRTADKSWARDIRRQVFELIFILAALVIAAAGYDFWSYVSIERVRTEINNHHLLANSHYLRAMEELRNLQIHHLCYRSRGGSGAVENLITLCHACHEAVHAGRITLGMRR